MPRCWLSIGSNQAREASIRGAVADLGAVFGTLILSRVYESTAVGFEGTPFLNLVAGIATDLGVAEIETTLRRIEDAYGRVRGPDKFAPRTLDIDLLTYGDTVGIVAGRELPRDEIFKYAFVLGPLAEVVPDEVCPGTGRTYAALWEEFDQAGQPLTPIPIALHSP